MHREKNVFLIFIKVYFPQKINTAAIKLFKTLVSEVTPHSIGHSFTNRSLRRERECCAVLIIPIMKAIICHRKYYSERSSVVFTTIVQL